MGAWGNGIWESDTAWDLAFVVGSQYAENVTTSINSGDITTALLWADLLLMVIERSTVTSAIPSPETVSNWQFSVIRQLHKNKQDTTEPMKLLMRLFDIAISYEEVTNE